LENCNIVKTSGIQMLRTWRLNIAVDKVIALLFYARHFVTANIG